MASLPQIKDGARVAALRHEELGRVVPCGVFAVDDGPDYDPVGIGGRGKGGFKVVEHA